MRVMEEESGSEESDTEVIQALEYKTLHKFPGTDLYFPNTLYYHSPLHNKSYLILSTDSRETNNGIFQYDIKLDIISKLADYPPEFHVTNHGNAIVNDMLYIFCGAYRVFAILNLKTLEWNIKCKNQFMSLVHHSRLDQINTLSYNILEMLQPKSVYIPHPINELHIFGNAHLRSYHMKYDEEQQTFIELSGVNGNSMLMYSHLIYVEQQQRMYIIGGEIPKWGQQVAANEIWYCSLNGDNDDYKWKLYEQELKDITSRIIDVILGFEWIIFVFYEYEIWCLDLMITQKWYKSSKVLIHKESMNMFGHGVKSDPYGDCVHFYEDMDYGHISISLFDVMPEKLTHVYRKWYDHLLSGYIRICEALLICEVPSDIKRLILCYMVQEYFRFCQ